MQDVNIWPPFKCVNSGSPTLVELHGSPTPFWDGHHGGIQWVLSWVNFAHYLNKKTKIASCTSRASVQRAGSTCHITEVPIRIQQISKGGASENPSRHHNVT